MNSLYPENTLERIGAGHCGTVWSSDVPSGALALKREDGGPGRSLKNEFFVQSEVSVATIPPAARLSQTLVPRCLDFLE